MGHRSIGSCIIHLKISGIVWFFMDPFENIRFLFLFFIGSFSFCRGYVSMVDPRQIWSGSISDSWIRGSVDPQILHTGVVDLVTQLSLSCARHEWVSVYKWGRAPPYLYWSLDWPFNLVGPTYLGNLKIIFILIFLG